MTRNVRTYANILRRILINFRQINTSILFKTIMRRWARYHALKC